MTEKKKNILEIAKSLFLSKGIMNTSMSDIGHVIGLNRRSIYRLFETKEDIAYQIATGILEEWNAENKREYDLLEGNALEKLESFLYRMIDDMHEQILEMRFLTEFDFYFRDASNSLLDVETQNRRDYENIVMNANTYIYNLLKQGIDDGSINLDMSIALMEATISNILWSFGQSISIRGNTIEKETGIKPITIIKNQVKLYIKALQ
ncbi:TetR/AcrR family transcriptional regulator [Vallitalea pronyensis]|uniref:TetR/AcrR family transcriptional regulator n=1 Tax=Vallitalea pronyensis TaxID=1348613 RepID=A0A8J8SHI1_9FIRM|nr:TetR/AcrR family transcriptional regulator [Vallitalea pronyensis]QUI23459.1 TetR/AcrR family transcriptional regulator [Vallitalea pronyensis]